MALKSRRKGAVGEREVVKLLKDAIGSDEVERNLSQSRDGGSDILLEEHSIAIEVKRVEAFADYDVSKWWNQCVSEKPAGWLPLLLYRKNRGKWRMRCFGSVMAYDGCFVPYVVDCLFDTVLFKQIASLRKESKVKVARSTEWLAASNNASKFREYLNSEGVDTNG